ncbi:MULTISPECIES: hypothetical protein [unclassified Streptomyces]|uniref:hypothetical protein n=1 Tax=unclassified Streptomyces TaxID=2593676 RepID=UPI0004BF8A3C|nr:MULTISPECIES: hypothetical protein [unclassified Streptomyces]
MAEFPPAAPSGLVARREPARPAAEPWATAHLIVALPLEPDAATLRTRTKPLAGNPPLHPHLSEDGDAP